MGNYLRIAIFCSLIGIFTGLAYWLLRFGLEDNSILEVFKVLGVLFFLLFIPLLIDTIFPDRTSSLLYHPIPVILICLFILVLLGCFLEFYSTAIPGWLISGIGNMLFCLYLISFIRKSTWQDYVAGFPSVLMAAVSNTGYIYSNFAKPHLFEALVAEHIPYNWPTDTLFHSSIAQMIRTYGVVSTGLDGVPYINYHFGSHFIFAGFSNLLQIDLLKFYLLCYPVVFSSLFFFFFLVFITQVYDSLKPKQQEMKMGLVFWILFLGMFIGFLKRGFIWHHGVQLMVPGIAGNSAIMVSESYLVSIIFLFALFTLVLLKIKQKPSLLSDYFFYIFLLPLLIFIIGVTKISTGFVVMCVLSYIYLRCSLFRNLLFNLSFFASAVAWLFSFILTKEPNHSEGLLTFEFFKNNKLSFITGFIMLHFLWTYILVIFYVLKKRVKSFSTLTYLAFKNKTLFVEVAIITAISGFIPKAILNLVIDGVFFTEIQFFVSTGILLAYICSTETLKFITVNPLKKRMGLVISFLLFSYVSYANAQHFMRDMVDSNFLFRKTIIGDYSETLPRLEITKCIRKGKFSSIDSIVSIYGKPVQDILYKKKEYAFIRKLRDLNKLSHQKRSKSILYTNYNQSELNWKIPCFDVIFLVPALSGIAQLDGMLVKETCSFPGYAMDYYKEKTVVEGKKIYSDKELCVLTMKYGYDQLIIYRADLNSFVTLSCK